MSVWMRGASWFDPCYVLVQPTFFEPFFYLNSLMFISRVCVPVVSQSSANQITFQGHGHHFT